MGFHSSVPPVLQGTMEQDGHVGCKCIMGGTHGIPWNSPTCPTPDNGTGRTQKKQVFYGRYPWDSVGQSRSSYMGQWDRMDK